MARDRTRRDQIDPTLRNTKEWPSLLTSDYPDELRASLDRRIAAVKGYVAGAPLKELRAAHGLTDNEIRRLTRRCLAQAPDGRIWGFRALAPHKHIASYQRRSALVPSAKTGVIGKAGALQQLLTRYPEIRSTIERHILNRPIKETGQLAERGREIASRMNHHRLVRRLDMDSLLRRFLRACREAGVPGHEYPFTEPSKGKRSLERYAKDVLRQAAEEAARQGGGPSAVKLLSTGLPARHNYQPGRPYSRVEFDAHKLDAIFAIDIPLPDGTRRWITLPRLWVLIFIDTLTRAILGYQLSLNLEYSAEDVLRSAERTIKPWTPRALTIPNLRYEEGAGMPSGVFSELQWAVWGELGYDNAESHLAKWVVDQLVAELGNTANDGPVSRPFDRPLIERFNEVLAGDFHRLPSTVGNGPRDSRRHRPEAAAIRYRMRLEHLEEILDVVLANHNVSGEGTFGRTPFEALEDELANGWLPVVLPIEKRERLNLLKKIHYATVRGNLAEGRRPFVQFEHVRYSSDILAQAPELINARLKLIVDIDDVQSLLAFLPNGEELGVLTALGPWSRRPHSLSVRKAIFKLIRERKVKVAAQDDPIETYNQYLISQVPNDKRAGVKLAQHRLSRADGASEGQPTPSGPTHEPRPTPRRSHPPKILDLPDSLRRAFH